MSLISRLFENVRSWRRRRRGPKAVRRATVSMEHLDHRRLLSVNFTGNVAADFLATTSPGVVVLPDNASVTHPTIASNLLPIVKVSGFDISGIRVTYTPSDDVLSIGIEQPPSQQTGQPGPVIAGDADNNGNDGTVNPAVTTIDPTFQDYPDFGGSEYMAAFLDLQGTGYADVLAGYAINDPRSPKEYQVAQAIVNTNEPPTTLPDFGTTLPQFTGNVYKVNSPAHPNLEFAIDDFSQLYLAETGKALTPNAQIGLGAFAGSGEDTGIGEAYFPEQTFTLSQATLPTTTPTCPPVSPPVIINPHENRHINTAHPTDIRVNIIGSSGFDVTKIEPSTVTLGGATPIFGFDRYINQDEWLDATFVFKGTDVTLPPGITEATVSGQLTNGQSFSSSVKVFNRNASFYSAAALRQQQQRVLAREARQNGFVIVPSSTIASAQDSPQALASEARQDGFVVVSGNSTTASMSASAQNSPQALANQARQDGLVVLSGSTSASAQNNSRALAREARQDGFVVVPSSTSTSAQNSPRALARQARQDGFVIVSGNSTTTGTMTAASTATTAAAVKVDYTTAQTKATKAPVVSIPRRDAAGSTPQTPKISARMQASINRMARNYGAVSVTQNASAV